MKGESMSTFIKKITSRKLWVAIAGLVTAVMTFFSCNSNTIVQVTSIIMAFGTVIGYLVANGLTDDSTVPSTENTVTKPPADTSSTDATTSTTTSAS